MTSASNQGGRGIVATLRGKVESVTADGDLVTDVHVSALGDAPRDDTLRIECAGHATQGLYPQDHDQPEMTFLALANEDGRVQIAIVGGNAHRFLGIDAGDDVSISW